jgi:hypothetical protein
MKKSSVIKLSIEGGGRVVASIHAQPGRKQSCRVGTVFVVPTISVVRPAGRVHLEVQVLYRPDRGNC